MNLPALGLICKTDQAYCLLRHGSLPTLDENDLKKKGSAGLQLGQIKTIIGLVFILKTG